MRIYITPDGGKYPSVTTIVSANKNKNPALINWKANNDNWRAILDYTAVRGTMVHIQAAIRMQKLGAMTNATQEIISAEEIKRVVRGLEGKTTRDFLDEVSIGKNFFTKFLAEHEIEPVFSEQVVWSEVHKYAGQVDQVMYIDGQLTIVDIKTAARVYPDSYGPQLAAYAHALAERTGEDVYKDIKKCHRAILLLSPDIDKTGRGTYLLSPLRDYSLEWFRMLRRFYNKYKIEDVARQATSVRDGNNGW